MTLDSHDYGHDGLAPMHKRNPASEAAIAKAGYSLESQ
jgi:hypothetical protein